MTTRSLSIALSLILCAASAYAQDAVVGKSAPLPPPSATAAPRTDCLIAATENYARIGKVAAWSNILLFRFQVDNNPTYGHAVVVWKITPSSKIFLSDTNGGSELATKSTDPEIITTAIGARWKEITHKDWHLSQGHFALEK
jgi:hypothetical protein